MIQTIKKYFIVILCLPIVFLSACSKSACKEVNSLSYYYEDNIQCDLFQDLPSKSIKLSDITRSKFNKSMLDAYAKLTIKANPTEIYHLYIEYLYFKVYTNENSEFEMNVNIEITNAIKESDVNTVDPKDNKFATTYSCIAKRGNVATFKVLVDRTIATTTGSTITIDILNSEIYATNLATTFKWCIFDFSIYGESRAY